MRASTPAFVAIALILSAGTATSQSRGAIQARAVVDSFFNAVEQEQWAAAARWIDGRVFEVILELKKRNYISIGRPTPMTPERLMASDSTMPRAVAEWEAAQRNRFTHDPAEDIAREFAWVGSVSALLQLSLDSAAARWVEAADYRYKVRHWWKRAGCTGEPPAIALRRERRPILGIIAPTDSTAYALRGEATIMVDNGSKFSPSPFQRPPAVLVLNRRAGEWKLDPESVRDYTGVGSVTGCNR